MPHRGSVRIKVPPSNNTLCDGRCVFAQRTDLDVPVHGRGLRGPDQPLQLGATVVLGLSRQFGNVDVGGEQVEAPHLVGVDGEDLDSALLVRETWSSRDGDQERSQRCPCQYFKTLGPV